MLQALFIKKYKEKIIEGLKKRYLLEIEEMLSLVKKILWLLDDKRYIQLKLNRFFFLFKKKSIQINKKKNKITSLYKFFFKKKLNITYISNILSSINKELLLILLKLPNLPHKYVKRGFSPKENEIIYNYGKIFDLKKNQHWNLNVINCEWGSKISGSGFIIYNKNVSKLHRAMIEYFLDYNIKRGYTEYTVPYLVKYSSAEATGQLPEKKKQMYSLSQDNLYLIPTGEIPLMNCYREMTLKDFHLPLKLTAYTPCFRKEAGSYGSRVRGLNRLHQFDKVEIIQITTTDFSDQALQEMVQHVKNILISLKLPFRLLRLCGGDMGSTSAITYDFEVYSHAQKQWLEISSITNCTDYQSNRLKLRYKKNNKKTIYSCHSLNGSSIAIQRILAVLLENFQTKEFIKIPEILIPYTGFEKIILS